MVRGLMLGIALGVVLSLPAQTLPSQIAPHRGITPQDYFSIQVAGDPQLSPDGTEVVYTVTTSNRASNKRTSRIWLADTTGSTKSGSPRPLTPQAISATSPRWSPDGKTVAFLATSGKSKPQIWVVASAGGEARPLTHLENGASNIEWSPDGTRFVCLSRTGPEPGPDSSDVRDYTHIGYKSNDQGFFDGLRTHVVIVNARTGTARQLTDGEDWNDMDPHWSPDSEHIAFVSDRSGHEFDLSRNTDVWVISTAGGPLARISNRVGSNFSPRWSPDGLSIAFLGTDANDEQPLIYISPAAGGKHSVPVSATLDQTVDEIAWAEHGSAIYFDSQVKGETNLYRMDAASGAVTAITSGERAVHALNVNPAAGKMVYLANDFGHPDDVYLREAGTEHRLTGLNSDLLKKRELARVERVPYTATDGLPVDGFLVKPIGWQAGRKYPLVLSIHGGPQGMYGVGWNQEFQVYAARGWAVFFTNPRGSTGYGRKFQRAVALEWGGKAYTDIMTGVEEVLKRNPWIDRTRLGVTGGSYGGYMTNWIVSHSNLFKAAVTLRGISDLVSDEGTRDFAYGHARDFGGDLYHNFDLYWKYSPIRYAADVKTPVLILHGENDQRVPLEQAEQWFRALQHFGVTSELVIFPRENHNLTRTGEPRHLVQSMEWQCYWFDRFLNGNKYARRPTEE